MGLKAKAPGAGDRRQRGHAGFHLHVCRVKQHEPAQALAIVVGGL